MSYIKKNILDATRQQIDGYLRFGYEDIVYDRNNSEHRSDLENYAIVTIGKESDEGKPVKVALVNADTIKRLSDPSKYMVLVFYPGGGRDEECVGILVRRDPLPSKETLNLAKNLNMG
jgi:hypothetical protein